MTYLIHNIEFKTKQQITQKVQEILYKNLGYVDKTDKEFLLDLLKTNTARWSQKRGEDVVLIETIKYQYGTQCFLLHRSDGSYEVFSFVKSINLLK